MPVDKGSTVIHLYKSARSLALSALSQALQLRCFQTAEASSIRLPDNAHKQQTCPDCCIPWIPGLTVTIRINIGNALRKSGGISKRGRIRKQRRLQRNLQKNHPPSLLLQYRKRTLVYECLACRGISTTELESATRPSQPLSTEVPIIEETLKKRELDQFKTNDTSSEKKMKISQHVPPSQPTSSKNTASITPNAGKKRARDRKTKTSLQYLLAKNKEKNSSSSSDKLGLNDFFKPG